MSGGSSAGGGARRPGLLVAGLVVLLAGGALVLAGVRSEDPPDDPTPYSSDYLTTPVDTTVGLRIGGFHILENTGPQGGPTTLTRDDIVLTGPDGVVPLEDPGTRSIGSGSDEYRAVAFVRVHQPGIHRLRVTSPEGGPTRLFLNDDGTGGSFSRWLAAAFAVLLGVVVGGTGLVLLGFGLTRRGTVPARVAPGWYRDPTMPQQLRWFDGTRWTEHRGAGPPPPADLAGREP
jgi:hypothetical protein